MHSRSDFVIEGCVYKKKKEGVLHFPECFPTSPRHLNLVAVLLRLLSCWETGVSAIRFSPCCRSTSVRKGQIARHANKQLLLFHRVFEVDFSFKELKWWKWEVLSIVRDFFLSLQAWVSQGVRGFSGTRAICLPELGLSRGIEGFFCCFFSKCFLLDGNLYLFLFVHLYLSLRLSLLLFCRYIYMTVTWL